MKKSFPSQIHAIYCIGRNYGAHAKELGNAIPESPVVFLKSPAAVRGLQDSGKIAYPSETFHHELELVLQIGPSLTNGSEKILTRIKAFGLGLDITRREVQNRLKKEGLPWTDAKSFRGSAVLTSVAELPRGTDIPSIESTIATSSFSLWVNGELRQKGSPRDMLFPCEKILIALQASHGLHDGDLVFTGTPEGVGPLRAGDTIRMQLTCGKEIVIDESGTF